MQAREIKITGIVQGVGFRPFIYNLAAEFGIRGSVRNTSEGVYIQAEGEAEVLDAFERAIGERRPPQAVIDSLQSTGSSVSGASGFSIEESVRLEGRYQLISPDIATCDACRMEIFDPGDRRYRYAFTNCTNCGPRFTIIEDIPYDRPLTTMAPFTMCARCQAEYDDPTNRRFHAQPNACPVCGPHLELWDRESRLDVNDPLKEAATLLREGKVLAIKGLGGFHLACDATSDAAVGTLRQRKGRVSKPFAIMVADMEGARSLAEVSQAEEELLRSTRAPIVLLREKPDTPVSRLVAPNQAYQGVMLPYTPLHHLLLAECGTVLVMTSGNYTEEPICSDNSEALRDLGHLADNFLFHDRGIRSRYDDSVVRVMFDVPRLVRRSRSYAPYPLALEAGPCVLAVGAELKSTFTLAQDSYAFVSQHLGDLDDEKTLRFFEETVQLYQRLFRAQPELVAHDLHPDYLSTRYAMSREGVEHIAVQHHHAHIVSCMAENDLHDAVLGVSMDGMGYGADGTLWGGELLLADRTSYSRLSHLRTFRQPGGDLATLRPYRLAISLLLDIYGPGWLDLDLDFCRAMREREEEAATVAAQAERGFNSPLTSSAGRLFDAVSALLGLRMVIDYEGQAAMELEYAALAGRDAALQPFPYEIGGEEMDWGPMLRSLVDAVQAGANTPEVAFRFHLTMAEMLKDACLVQAASGAPEQVALSGGVFQNLLLNELLVPRLAEAGFEVFTQSRVPCNDGGLSLGQAAVARALAKEAGSVKLTQK